MKLMRIGRVNVHLHPTLFLVLFGAYVFEMMEALVLALLAITLHEMSHALIAFSMGCEILKIELLPFGGAVRMSGRISTLAEISVAAAGPACSMVIAAMCALMSKSINAVSPALMLFMRINLSLALINLLPALPLDGGRILRALLSKVMRAKTATNISAFLGVLLGALLIGMSAYYFLIGVLQITMAIMGIFLVFAAVVEMKGAKEAKLHSMYKRQNGIMYGEALSVKHIAMHEDVNARDAMSKMKDNRYNLIRVVDSNMRGKREIDEGTLMDALGKHGIDIKLKDI